MSRAGARRTGLIVGVIGLLMQIVSAAALAESPAQRLPSAVLIYPLIDTDGGFSRDTRVELVNLTSRMVELHCFYIEGNACFEIGFFVRLTANQPMSWLASEGTSNTVTHTNVPPFFGQGELKCAVVPNEPGLEAHNAVQGRAVVFGSDGSTFGYGAVAFQRLAAGDFTSLLELDGQTYARCPDEQHFIFLASDPFPAKGSELIMAPCTEDLENQVPTSTTVQFSIINEFEQHLSASITVNCYSRQQLNRISSVFTFNTLGSDTGHLIVRGVHSPVTALVIDRFDAGAADGAAVNEPALEGGRAATILFP
jgi:hypothetical protein